MHPFEVLREIAAALDRGREPFRARAFRTAANAVKDLSEDDLLALAAAGRLTDLPGVGSATATAIAEALADQVPAYLQRARGLTDNAGTDAGNALRARLRGDLHAHSDWSDGGSTVREMAIEAKALGHEYLALTDHSPRLTVARGLSAERLHAQLDLIAQVNEELAPFRLLTGVEVDINEDGSLDHDDGVLARLDVVVASVHSKLRMEPTAMTQRLVRALAHPHADILGHCTGRIVTGRGRAESEFDTDAVFAACVEHGKAIEVNARPERLDPPRRMLRELAERGVLLAVDTDAHATDQLVWQTDATDRAAECGVDADRIVNTWPLDRLLEWCATHT